MRKKRRSRLLIPLLTVISLILALIITASCKPRYKPFPVKPLAPGDLKPPQITAVQSAGDLQGVRVTITWNLSPNDRYNSDNKDELISTNRSRAKYYIKSLAQKPIDDRIKYIIYRAEVMPGEDVASLQMERFQQIDTVEEGNAQYVDEHTDANSVLFVAYEEKFTRLERVLDQKGQNDPVTRRALSKYLSDGWEPDLTVDNRDYYVLHKKVDSQALKRVLTAEGKDSVITQAKMMAYFSDNWELSDATDGKNYYEFVRNYVGQLLPTVLTAGGVENEETTKQYNKLIEGGWEVKGVVAGKYIFERPKEVKIVERNLTAEGADDDKTKEEIAKLAEEKWTVIKQTDKKYIFARGTEKETMALARIVTPDGLDTETKEEYQKLVDEGWTLAATVVGRYVFERPGTSGGTPSFIGLPNVLGGYIYDRTLELKIVNHEIAPDGKDTEETTKQVEQLLTDGWKQTGEAEGKFGYLLKHQAEEKRIERVLTSDGGDSQQTEDKIKELQSKEWVLYDTIEDGKVYLFKRYFEEKKLDRKLVYPSLPGLIPAITDLGVSELSPAGEDDEETIKQKDALLKEGFVLKKPKPVVEPATYVFKKPFGKFVETGKGKLYAYRVGIKYKYKEKDEEKEQTAISEPSLPVTTTLGYFYFEKSVTLVLVILFVVTSGYFIVSAKRGKEFYIRPIAGINAVEEAVGRAAEMGRSCLFVPGIGGVANPATLASLAILSKIAEKTAQYDTGIIMPNVDVIVIQVAQEVIKEAYVRAGRPDAYNPDMAFFLSDRQFAYAGGVSGLMAREKPAAVFLLGSFYAESLLLAEASANIGAISVAGTDMDAQLPFFVTACDYTLIGEELYAAGAYLGRDPKLLGTLKAQDFFKAITMVLIVALVIGVIVAFFGGDLWLASLFKYVFDREFLIPTVTT